MKQKPENPSILSFLPTLQRRLAHREIYLDKKDPIADERLLWQAQSFRHLVHILPGETILEIGTGKGIFTKALHEVTRGRNPITTVSENPEIVNQATKESGAEIVSLSSFPASLSGRSFDYVVSFDTLDQDNAAFLCDCVHSLLKPGGKCVFFEPNPWNPLFVLKSFLRHLIGRKDPQLVFNKLQLYELLSAIGFVRISCWFTDFLYAPLTPTPRLVWWLKHLSVVCENTPILSIFAGRIIIHSQKPPRERKRQLVSLFNHEYLKKKISVVVPCHNEEMNVSPLVEHLMALFGDYICQLVLVNDNSTDRTGKILDSLAKKHSEVTPIHRSPPGGVGNALRDGINACTGDYVLTMDCDFQHLLPEMEDLFDAAAEGCDVVIGSRFSRHSVLVNYPFGKIMVNRLYHTLAVLLFRWRKRDLTNNLKLMTREIAQSLSIPVR